ncbi:MAG: hypothetical protein IKW38_02750 [Kiritimatiellae bacterium]|nr:hypothetical protein [Kiritimatiellia bacterium]
MGLTIGIGNSPHVHIPKIPTRTAEARQLILATLPHAPALCAQAEAEVPPNEKRTPIDVRFNHIV